MTLDNFDVDPRTKPVLHVALERTRAALGLTDELADGIIAKQLIRLVEAGERDPDRLCEGALNYAGICSETNTGVKAPRPAGSSHSAGRDLTQRTGLSASCPTYL
jgi:hypothetical protein